MDKAIILVLLFSLAIFSQNNKEPETVKKVDLKKYIGKWYEIAKIPNSFQKQCVRGTTAEYSLENDGKIKVVNSCIDEDGKRDEADGVAKIVDKQSNSKLEVSFVSFLGWRPFWGDYWILGLGPNYEYSVVGTPDRKYGWILGREKKLTEKQLNEAYEILKKNGYDVKKFIMSEQ
ncbi:MAG TPA: lipocalin family protein [Ignavibacteriaceae bacterium]|nr:lipocalin family protein [Ignavibacteriaceae bacterium]